MRSSEFYSETILYAKQINAIIRPPVSKELIEAGEKKKKYKYHTKLLNYHATLVVISKATLI